MKYDFENVVDRALLGSSKWLEMKTANPDVPDGIIPLSVADMELKNPPQLMAGLRRFLDHDTLSLGYTTTTDSYDAAVSSWMTRRHGWCPDMQWNVLSPGVVTALFMSVRAFTDTGDGVIIFSPVYYPFKMAVERAGRALTDVPLVQNGTRYEIDWASFEKAALEPKNKLLLFCSPHNPVGRVWTEPELRRVAEICAAGGVKCVSDEIHSDIIMPGHKHTVYASISQEAEQSSIICTAPTKTFSLAGIQTSNIFIPNEVLRERFRAAMMDSAIFTLNAVGLKACEIAYNECGDWLEQVLGLIAENAAVTERFMAERIPQIKVYPLEGTYLQWWDCRELFPDYRQMETFMRTKALLFLDEGYMFGETGAGFERINLACPTRVLTDALDRFYAALLRENIL